MDLMRLHDLAAVNTYFEPRKGETAHTYLATKQHDMAESIQNDRGEYVGVNVLTKYKGKQISGKVVSVNGTNNNSDLTSDNTSGPTNIVQRQWTVRFAGGFTKRYSRHSLEEMLVVGEKEKIGKQLDYIFISNRRKSCVMQCRPRWGPSRHRNRHGQRDDHTLLEWKWKWRLRTVKANPVRDYTPLYKIKQETNSAILTNFETVLTHRLTELEYSNDTDTSTAMYDKFRKAVTHATEATLPIRRKTKNLRAHQSTVQATHRNDRH